ncbi:transposable element Tcb2 transposase [Trichonephila clavipes]|nr:transposable element Tcb2 transposase [Trichonephila clavipes]
MVVNDRTASSRQLAARLSTATGVLMSASSIRRRLQPRGLRARVPLRQSIDGCVCGGLTSTEPDKLIGTKLSFQMNYASICGIMMAPFVLDAMTPEVVPFLRSIPGAIFQQDNVRPYVAKTIPYFCSAQHMHLLPWPAYLEDMSPIEHVWDLVGRHFAHDPRPAKTNFCCAYKQ